MHMMRELTCVWTGSGTGSGTATGTGSGPGPGSVPGTWVRFLNLAFC